MSSMFPTVNLLINVSSVGVLWLGANRVAVGRHPGRLARRLPQLPRADPDVGGDGDVHGLDDPAGRRCRPTASRRCSTPTPSVVPPAEPGRRRRRRTARSSSATSASTTPAPSTPVLSDISFTTAAGQTTAIVGSTGAGKTTLVNLIPRLFDATDGHGARRRRRRARARPRRALEHASASCRRGRTCSRARSRATSSTASPTPPRRRCGRRSRSRRPPTSCGPCPAGSRPASSRAAPTCRAGSASGSRSPGRSIRKPEIYVFDDSFSALDLATDARLRAALGPYTARRRGRDRRPAGVDDLDRRPDPRARGRRARRPRHPRRAARELPDLRRDRRSPRSARGARHDASLDDRRRRDEERRGRPRGARDPAPPGRWNAAGRARPSGRRTSATRSAGCGRLLRPERPSCSSSSCSPIVSAVAQRARPAGARPRHRRHRRAASSAGGHRLRPSCTTCSSRRSRSTPASAVLVDR